MQFSVFDSLNSLQPVFNKMATNLASEVERFKNNTDAFERTFNRSNAIDHISLDDMYVILFDVPGVDQKDMNITVQDGNIVRIVYNRENKFEGAQRVSSMVFANKSIKYGRGEVLIKLPADANFDEVNVVVKNGVMEMTVPKLVPMAKPPGRQVPISWSN